MSETKIPVLTQVPQGSIEAYLRVINSYPMLTAEQEKELSEKLYYDGDLEAAKMLVLSHLRFVAHVARNYSGYGLAQADLIQEGNAGLMKAVKRFNPNVGVRLVSFAVHWIKAEIHEYVVRNWRVVKVATTKSQRKLFFNLRRSKKRLGWFTNEEIAIVAKELGVSPKDVLEMESRMAARDVAFELERDDNDDSIQLSPSYYVEDKSSNFAKTVEDDNWEDDTSDQLAHALESLDERSRDIIESRWLNDDDNKPTLHKLAEKYNVSAERIRQLEKNAMNKLKTLIAI